MVLLITSGVTFLIAGVWRNSSYLFEAALARTATQRLLRSTNGLLCLGIELANENYAVLIANKQETRVPIPGWYSHADKKYTGVLVFVAQKEGIGVSALLQDTMTIACALKCMVRIQKGNRPIIRDWSLDSTV